MYFNKRNTTAYILYFNQINAESMQTERREAGKNINN